MLFHPPGRRHGFRKLMLDPVRSAVELRLGGMVAASTGSWLDELVAITGAMPLASANSSTRRMSAARSTWRQPATNVPLDSLAVGAFLVRQFVTESESWSVGMSETARLHQPSAFYGVNSMSLGSDRIDADGTNAGFYERATSAEICAYYSRMLDRMLESGKVQVFPNSEYVGDSTVVSRISGQRVSDPTSGFRLYNAPAIALFARDYPHDYPEVEAVLMVHHHRLRMVEVPVRMFTRGGGVSSISSGKSFYYMVKVLLALFVGVDVFEDRTARIGDQSDRLVAAVVAGR